MLFRFYVNEVRVGAEGLLRGITVNFRSPANKEDRNGPAAWVFRRKLTAFFATATLADMEIHFTPEQEARLVEIASALGKPPALLVQDAALSLIEDRAKIAKSIESGSLRKVCPECGHRFRGKGWDGIDAHWRANHEHILPYELAWPLILSGKYDSTEREDLEDIREAEKRLEELRAGRSLTHSLQEVECELGLVD